MQGTKGSCELGSLCQTSQELRIEICYVPNPAFLEELSNIFGLGLVYDILKSFPYLVFSVPILFSFQSSPSPPPPRKLPESKPSTTIFSDIRKHSETELWTLLSCSDPWLLWARPIQTQSWMTYSSLLGGYLTHKVLFPQPLWHVVRTVFRPPVKGRGEFQLELDR